MMQTANQSQENAEVRHDRLGSSTSARSLNSWQHIRWHSRAEMVVQLSTAMLMLAEYDVVMLTDSGPVAGATVYDSVAF
jgi:hypothetical protein